MPQFSRLTASSQVVEHLREKILQGEWGAYLPGRNRLAAELGVSHMTVGRAMAELEQEGLLANEGKGKRRRILVTASCSPSRKLQIAVLRYEAEDARIYYVVDFVHQLREAGHQVQFVDRTLCGMKMNPQRVARLVEQTDADAWIVIGGSNEILEWFASRDQPCFGLFGKISKLPIAGAGPLRNHANLEAVRRLVELGHQRIVMLDRYAWETYWRYSFLNLLKENGIEAGDYNMPRFTDTPEGLHACLESLFAATPPTAIITINFELFFVLQQFLARRNLRTPEDVSLICGDPNPYFQWCKPGIAHISWDSGPWVRRIQQWARKIASGKTDCRKAIIEARFIDGGTVGPAPKAG